MNKGLKYTGGKNCATGVILVLTVATIKNAIFWNAMLHVLVELNRHFQESSQQGQEDPLICQYIFTRLQNITSQQTVILMGIQNFSMTDQSFFSAANHINP
jgi:hypothetical protein